jgi:hypothetical protein
LAKETFNTWPSSVTVSPQLRARTPEADGEAPPQFGCEGVEQDRAGVVVAVRADRLAQPRIVGTVAFVAGHWPAVWAGAALPAGSAAQSLAVLYAQAVDGSEGWCGQGEEDCRVFGDFGGDAFAADQAGADELVGVGAVGLGARRAAGGAAGLAGDAQDAAGFVRGGVAVEEGAVERVAVFDFAAQVDGLGASSGAADLGGPAVVVRVVVAGDHAVDGVLGQVVGQDGWVLSQW